MLDVDVTVMGARWGAISSRHGATGTCCTVRFWLFTRNLAMPSHIGRRDGSRSHRGGCVLYNLGTADYESSKPLDGRITVHLDKHPVDHHCYARYGRVFAMIKR